MGCLVLFVRMYVLYKRPMRGVGKDNGANVYSFNGETNVGGDCI